MSAGVNQRVSKRRIASGNVGKNGGSEVRDCITQLSCTVHYILYNTTFRKSGVGIGGTKLCPPLSKVGAKGGFIGLHASETARVISSGSRKLGTGGGGGRNGGRLRQNQVLAVCTERSTGKSPGRERPPPPPKSAPG